MSNITGQRCQRLVELFKEQLALLQLAEQHRRQGAGRIREVPAEVLLNLGASLLRPGDG